MPYSRVVVNIKKGIAPLRIRLGKVSEHIFVPFSDIPGFAGTNVILTILT